mgnify:CR=1 FL=1
MIIPGTGETTHNVRVTLGEVGALAAELRHLSTVTRDKQYARAVEQQLTALFQLETLDGIFPDSISRKSIQCVLDATSAGRTARRARASASQRRPLPSTSRCCRRICRADARTW